MITPRTTRLVRTADLHAFRTAVVSLTCDGDPLHSRNRLVVVPTRAAAAHLLRSIEDLRFRPGLDRSANGDGAVLLPDLVTPGELVARFVARLSPGSHRALHPAQREVLLGVACRTAIDAGAPPPFRLRPGLIAEILRFYDALRRQQKDVDTFERLALGALEPGAEHDRGAERLVRQTRFLAAAFRAFESDCRERGYSDEHVQRALVLAHPADSPWRHVVLAVGDRTASPYGLFPADWALLAQVPGLDQLDLVVTDRTLAGAFHERVHHWLPGIEEVRFDTVRFDELDRRTPVLRAPTRGPRGTGSAGAAGSVESAANDALVWTERDREEEIGGFARWVRAIAREHAGAGVPAALDRIALVVRQPLPYVYLAREVLRAAGVASQTFDALPLAAEPAAAALDLVFAFVDGRFSRGPAVALLQSPHFAFALEGAALGGSEIAALDRVLSEAGYLGELPALDRLVSAWQAGQAKPGPVQQALPAARLMLAIAVELEPLCNPAPVADHLERLLRFLSTHQSPVMPADPEHRIRHLRARAAIRGLLVALHAAYREFDALPAGFDQVSAMVRRWIEGHTFAPRAGDTGVHVVDAESARFGAFDCVQLAGLVEGEWPERPSRNIFYSPAILRDLGWPAEADRLDYARSSFVNLLGLPASQLVVSTFALENDSVVVGSTLLDELGAARLTVVRGDVPAERVFEYEALGLDPVSLDPLAPAVRAHASWRAAMPAPDHRYRGQTAGHAAAAFSLSALERYQDCPFKFFAADVLRLEERPEDEQSLSPRARGRFVHEVFQRFFEAWDRRPEKTITAVTFDAARTLFAEIAEPLLQRLPQADAELERARLFGSLIAVGIVDVVLGIEAQRTVDVRERWLEYRLEGEFTLGDDGGRRVSLRGVADRIDLLDGNRLRVIDYKTGQAPSVKRALQVPIYALCAQERLGARDGEPWSVDEAAYVAFSGKRTLVPVLKAGGKGTDVLIDARERLHELLDGITGGLFPVQPHEPMWCTSCAYASVCRKDYVGDE